MAYEFNTEEGNVNGDYIKVNNIDSESYTAVYLSHQRYLPKNINIYLCGTEMDEDGNLGRAFSLYRKYTKTGHKSYIIFSKYF